MDNLNLNLTETCFSCRKFAARWQLSLAGQQTDYPRGSVKTPSQTESGSDYAILFCPNCDQVTPEDLEENDPRTLTLPTPSTHMTEPYQLTFHGALEYRTAMGPDRPWRPNGGKTMRRRYNFDGTEQLDNK